MCYNKDISLVSYILGVGLSSYLFIIGDKYDKNFALFCFTFIQIQLAEYFMWMDQECNLINKMATICAYIILAIQPLSILIGSYFYKTTHINDNILIIMILFNLFILFVTINYYYKNFNKFLCSESYENKGLIWDHLKIDYFNYLIYFIALFLIWPFFKNFKKGIFIFISLLLILFKNLYDFKKNQFKKTWKSHWCIESIILILFYLIFIKFF